MVRIFREKQMTSTLKLAAAALSGAAVGAFGIQMLHAQAQPPVYQITLQDVSNAEALTKEFVPLARETIKKHGGKVLGSGAPIMLDGAAPAKRVVVNQWPSIEVAKAWYSSAEYQKAREIGNKYAKFTVLLVEGVPAPK
jgi:uncharacterized protein (DUF1330 family)